MSLLNDLCQAGIIEEQDVSELKTKLKGNESKPGEPLRTLYLFFESQVTTRPATGGFRVIVHPLAGYNSENSQDNATYSRFLNILTENRVISEIVFQKIKGFPLKADKYSYFAALYLSSELTDFYEHFTINKQLEFAQLLGGKEPYGRDSMLDQRKKNKLNRDINAGKLETYLDFFKYCSFCDFIDLAEYEGHPEKLMKKLTKILNTFCYGAFTISGSHIIEEDFIGEPSYNNKQTTIILDIGYKKHQHIYTYSEGEGRTAHKPGLIVESLLTFVNKLLADYTCNYRFTGVINRLNQELFPGSRTRYAICRVDYENKNVFEFYDTQRRFLFNRPSPLFYRFPLSYTHIEYAIYHFGKCGILSHLNNDQLNVIRSSIYQNTYEHIGDLIVAFTNVIAIVNQTVTPGQQPYLDLLLSLNRISHGFYVLLKSLIILLIISSTKQKLFSMFLLPAIINPIM